MKQGGCLAPLVSFTLFRKRYNHLIKRAMGLIKLCFPQSSSLGPSHLRHSLYEDRRLLSTRDLHCIRRRLIPCLAFYIVRSPSQG
jgi:hypothetical protein